MLAKIFFKIYSVLRSYKARIKLGYYEYLWKNQIEIEGVFTFGKNSQIDMQSGTSKAIFKNGVHFKNYCSILCSNVGELTLGENVFFNNYSSINCLHKITIGDNSIFGEGVRLYDHNHQFYNKEKTIIEQSMKYGAIEIGANCWIGSNTVILPNVVIGNNVVIGANNLIFKSIPDDTIIMSKSEVLLKSY